jgi:hypothetical protein
MRASVQEGKGKEVKVQKYQVPELQYVGEANKVVLGQENLGGDVWGMLNLPEQEFEGD